MTTPVIFRKDKRTKEIVAFFPTLPGTGFYLTCLCYEHVGQHSVANKGYYDQDTEPALPSEYENLRRELRYDIGYDDLIVRRKWIRQFDVERIKELKGIYGD